MAEIVLENVSKNIGKINVVKSISLTIEDNSVCVLAGPKGAGKTMILNMIAGLKPPTRGKIFINNNLVNHTSPSKRNIAFIFDDYALYPKMTVYENIAFGLKMRGVNKKKILSTIVNAAETLEIEHILGKYPARINSVQSQRVAIARAIVKEPQIILFDSPLTTLERTARYELRGVLKKLQKKHGWTMIYSSNDPIEAMAIADKICLLKDGAVEQIADPFNSFYNPVSKYAAQFMLEPSVNFFDIEIIQKENGFYLKTADFELLFPAQFSPDLAPIAFKKAVLALKAEDIVCLTDETLLGETPLEDLAYIRADILETEFCGGKKAILAGLGATKFKAQALSSFQNLSINQSLIFVFDLSEALLFDPQTGERIL
ncbi:MAG: ABC transporter ATP-binding protein [Elusimicrobiota bacterium]|jgi:multiple sugar transport system ATP-binding protein|nr:ABC transporter ATP-binding protein [Elusimicrobiota bacterium]